MTEDVSKVQRLSMCWSGRLVFCHSVNGKEYVYSGEQISTNGIRCISTYDTFDAFIENKLINHLYLCLHFY